MWLFKKKRRGLLVKGTLYIMDRKINLPVEVIIVGETVTRYKIDLVDIDMDRYLWVPKDHVELI